MKKALTLGIALLMLVVVTACGSSSNDTVWKDYIKDYTAVVDKYIAAVEKQKANPTDTAVLSEFTDIMTEMTAFTDEARLEEVRKSIGNDKAKMEQFTSELEAQAKRVTDSMAELQY